MPFLLAAAAALLTAAGLVLDLADNAHRRRWGRYTDAISRRGA